VIEMRFADLLLERKRKKRWIGAPAAPFAVWNLKLFRGGSHSASFTCLETTQ
jgi:hypothetical protein